MWTLATLSPFLYLTVTREGDNPHVTVSFLRYNGHVLIPRHHDKLSLPLRPPANLLRSPAW